MGVEQTLFCSLWSVAEWLRAAPGEHPLLPARETHCCLWVLKLLYPRHGQGAGMQVKKALLMASK